MGFDDGWRRVPASEIKVGEKVNFGRNRTVIKVEERGDSTIIWVKQGKDGKPYNRFSDALVYVYRPNS